MTNYNLSSEFYYRVGLFYEKILRTHYITSNKNYCIALNLKNGDIAYIKQQGEMQ